MAKNPLKKLRKEADAKYQEVCMMKEGLCEVCKTRTAYCCHHLVAKSLSNRLRYEIKNGIRVCRGCHNLIHSTADPAIFRKIEKAVGKKRMNWLEKTRREPVKINQQFYLEALNKLNKWKKKEQLVQTPF